MSFLDRYLHQPRNFWLEKVIQDARYAIRALVKRPCFTCVVLLSLGVGVGACTGVFTVINAVVLNPVPGLNASRLVEICEYNARRDQERDISPPLYADLQGQHEVFETVGCFEETRVPLTGGEFIQNLVGCRVTDGFFASLKASPSIGRGFSSEDYSAQAEDRVIISYDLWWARFGGDKQCVGRTVSLGERRVTILGVMPVDFRFPSGATQIWEPLHFDAATLNSPEHRFDRDYGAIGILRPSVSRDRAAAVLANLAKNLGVQNPGANADWQIRVKPISDLFLAPKVQLTFWTMLTAIGLVILIMCANLGSLQLIRAEAQQKELGIRMALGADRWEIVRLLLIQSILLAFAGGILGFIVAQWAVVMPLALVPNSTPMIRPIRVDARMLGFALLISGATAVGFGLIPALKASRPNLNGSLKQSSHTSSVDPQSKVFHFALVTCEVALAFMLTTTAVLMIRSVVKLLRVDPGFDPHNLCTVAVENPHNKSSDLAARNESFAQLYNEFHTLPGTISVGLYDSGFAADFCAEGHEGAVYARDSLVGVDLQDYFIALKTPLLSGRLFDLSDIASGRDSVIVDEKFAAMCWPGENPIGKHFWRGKTVQGSSKVVIGVVKVTKRWSYENEPVPAFYEPLKRVESVQPVAPNFYIRSNLERRSMSKAIPKAVRAIFGQTTAPAVTWLEDKLYSSTYSRRLYTWILTFFAAVGEFLASLGIYGALTYAVSRRTREIGIRMALGADRSRVLRMVFKEGIRSFLAGALFGTLCLFAISNFLKAQIANVHPLEAYNLFTSTLILGGTALLACYLPAFRATRVNPVIALKAE